MNCSRTFVYLCATSLTLGAASLPAQSGADARLVNFGIAGGVALPTTDIHVNEETFTAPASGYVVMALLEVNLPFVPFGVRADAMYQGLRFEDDAAGPGSGDGEGNILAGTVNGVFRLPGLGVRPYLIAGVGYYNLAVDLENEPLGQALSEDTRQFGVNGGIGLRIPLGGINAFIEARYHNIYTDIETTAIIPVVFGIRF